jgi:uncharacterized protein YbjT (DUF2867 family)
MKALVIGATGTVGSVVVRELLNRKVGVRALTRSGDKAKGLPEGVEPAVADIGEPTTLGPVFDGVDAVFMLNALSKMETHEGMMGLLAAKQARVKRFVYMSVHFADRDPLIPHFAAKVPVEKAIAASGIPYTILRPNNFYQNDAWFRDALLQYGVYPQPLGDAGVSRVDVRDIAEAATIALTTGGHEGRTYNLVGPKPWTGAVTAEAWGKALGRKIAYGGNDLDAWEKASLAYTPAWLVYDFKIMYRNFQEKGFLATADDVARLTTMLGHAPRGFEAYTQETAAAWSATAAKG